MPITQYDGHLIPPPKTIAIAVCAVLWIVTFVNAEPGPDSRARVIMQSTLACPDSTDFYRFIILSDRFRAAPWNTDEPTARATSVNDRLSLNRRAITSRASSTRSPSRR